MPDDRTAASALARQLSGMSTEEAGIIARVVSAARRFALSPGLPQDAVSAGVRNMSLCCPGAGGRAVLMATTYEGTVRLVIRECEVGQDRRS